MLRIRKARETDYPLKRFRRLNRPPCNPLPNKPSYLPLHILHDHRLDNLDHQRTNQLHHRRLPPHATPHLRAHLSRTTLHLHPEARLHKQ